MRPMTLSVYINTTPQGALNWLVRNTDYFYFPDGTRPNLSRQRADPDLTVFVDQERLHFQATAIGDNRTQLTVRWTVDAARNVADVLLAEMTIPWPEVREQLALQDKAVRQKEGWTLRAGATRHVELEELQQMYRGLLSDYLGEGHRPSQADFAASMYISLSTLKRRLRTLDADWRRDFSYLTPTPD